MSRQINDAGLALIKQYEGFKSEPYLDAVSKPTIGFGSTFYADGTPVTMQDSPIDEDTASQLLQDLLDKNFCPKVESLIKVTVNDNQYSAIVCFAYNVGLGNLQQSTLLRCLNAKNWKDAANEFMRWNHAGGKVLAGLTARRKAESELFSS